MNIRFSFTNGMNRGQAANEDETLKWRDMPSRQSTKHVTWEDSKFSNVSSIRKQDTQDPAAPGTSLATEMEHSNQHQVKWIGWMDKQVPIVTQNHNGPCPLIAIANWMILKGCFTLPKNLEFVKASKLIELIEKSIPVPEVASRSEESWVNYQRNKRDVIRLLPSLAKGLDVNVKFTGISDFEYTPACMIFDLLQVPLYHGWVIDPDVARVMTLLHENCSYNQLVEKIIEKKTTGNPNEVAEAILAENYLNFTATQLTHCGLEQLQSKIPNGQLCVLFRNNHFITLYKRNHQLLQLVTDEGFCDVLGVVWETLTNVKGDEDFLDSQFQPYGGNEDAFIVS